jgi:hypothetical protein
MRRLALSLPTALLLATACGTSSGPAPAEPPLADAGPAPGTKVQDAPITRGRIGSKAEEADFHVTKGNVSLDGKYEKVLLVLDLESPCFPFDKWKDEPPPPGHNWPASCDAFDRNFETALFDPSKPDAPGLELVRAITPFGGPLHVEEDVTDIWNGLDGPARAARPHHHLLRRRWEGVRVERLVVRDGTHRAHVRAPRRARSLP